MSLERSRTPLLAPIEIGVVGALILALPRAWNRRRMRGLIPALMEELHWRDPLEVLDCADAVSDFYGARRFCGAPRSLVRRRTLECLEAGVCEGRPIGTGLLEAASRRDRTRSDAGNRRRRMRKGFA